MKKDVIVEKTSKYISIQSYLIGRVSMTNINKSPVFLDTTTSLKKLGEAIYLELEIAGRYLEKNLSIIGIMMIYFLLFRKI